MEYDSFMHEIKNSLKAINGIASLIEYSNDTNEIKQYAGLLKESVTTLKDIENDFSVYRKTGRNTINNEFVDIPTVVRCVVESNKKIIQQYNIQIEPIYKQAKAYTDSNKLKQVVTNLLTNACKYSNIGGTVKIACYTSNSKAKIVIKDYGIGMTKEELNNIGKVFYRAKKVDRPGTGLGLGIVMKIARLLNYELYISSKLGVGTKVELVL